jgi:peptide/nickel transport system permease protein
MTQYLIRRLLLLVPVLLGVSIAVFSLIRFIPGDPAVLTLGQAATPEAIAQVRQSLRLDDPLPVQYAAWLGRVLRGDLGTSIESGRPVTREIWERLPVTLELLIIAVGMSLVIAIPLGVISAIRANSVADYAARLGAIAGLSIPGFWIGQMMIVLPSIWWNHAPPFGYRPFFDDPLTNIQQFYLPGIALGIGAAAILIRLTRSSLLEVMRADYIRTAWSKGMRERTIVIRHALKNGLIPIITVLGLQIGALMGGTVIMESVFALPGMGRLSLDSITRRDYPVVQGIVLLMATSYVLINLVVDLIYGWLDPRIHFH